MEVGEAIAVLLVYQTINFKMEVLPLSSLNSLLSWAGPGHIKKVLDQLPALQPRSPSTSVLEQNNSQAFQYKTLVCHDLSNGYHDDKFCFGTSNCNAYRFYHWSALDTFVYFSHHFVTIPPYGWVYTAHIHGVKILGTLITEWDKGESAWQSILNDDAIMELVINNLVEIAVTYRFDGWLLNVENKIEAEKVVSLVYFVNELTRRIKFRNPDSEVIWYDSVTSDGKLTWQNELNDKNKCYFDVCDGIFLNYSWKEKNISNSVAAAGDRVQDVYVGVDVYGRNFYEGGGFNCNKALDVIRKNNLSTAIFAQGWTFETLGSDNFFENENKFWGTLQTYMNYHGPATLPLKTSFCQGFGKNYYQQGKSEDGYWRTGAIKGNGEEERSLRCVIDEEGSWFNLSRQQIQPIWEEVSRSSLNRCSISTDEAYTGGSCLSLWVNEMTVIRLMVFKLSLSQLTEFTFAYKLRGTVKYLAFSFTFQDDRNEEKSDEREITMIAEWPEAQDPSLDTIFPELKSEENSWRVRKFFLPKREGWLTDFKIKAQGPGLVFFGQVSINELV